MKFPSRQNAKAFSTMAASAMRRLGRATDNAFVVLRSPRCDAMSRAMFFESNNLQILYAIIEFVSIFVMDTFRRLKRSSEMLFHYMAMLNNSVSIWKTKLNVTCGIDPTATGEARRSFAYAVRVVAGSAAVFCLATFYSTENDCEHFVAMNASTLDPCSHRRRPAFCGAKLSTPRCFARPIAKAVAAVSARARHSFVRSNTILLTAFIGAETPPGEMRWFNIHHSATSVAVLVHKSLRYNTNSHVNRLTKLYGNEMRASTTAATFTLDSATTPTSTTRAS